MIDGFVILPGDDWVATSTNVMVIVEDIRAVQTICGTITNFSNYAEVRCGVAGIKVIIIKTGALQQLRLCGYAVLSSCDCSTTSFDPLMMPNSDFTGLVYDSFNITATVGDAANKFVLQSQNTVSLVCGKADGTTCATTTTFTLNDSPVQFPSNGINWD
jgi:hypothetical protein